MDKPRPCGCKGCRTCLICEEDFKIDTKVTELNKEAGLYLYCPYCKKAWPGWDFNDYKTHPNHRGKALDYPGIYIKLDFLSEPEEQRLINNIDSMPWDLSQSGRRKQNFGPKCNFKKRKLKLGNFDGFPSFSKFLQDKFHEISILENFQTIEQCSLEYNPKRGAAIDPHIDDCWIWGERIVTVNLLADSVLTMTYNEKPNKYNLDCVALYRKILDKNGNLSKSNDSYKIEPLPEGMRYPVIRIPMPRRSLLVLYGSARYDWEHQVLREDILERRVCLAYREFTPPYLEGGNKSKEGKEVLEKAKHVFQNF